jgi:hypothetical protein
MRLPRLKAGKGKKSLGREIAVVLAIKLAALYGLWYAFFSHPAVQDLAAGMSPDRVAAAVVGTPVPLPTPDPKRGS